MVDIPLEAPVKIMVCDMVEKNVVDKAKYAK